MITRASGWSLTSPFHIATRAIPKTRGSLGGYGQNSLADVHLEIGLGASDFNVKGELRLGDALGVHILNLRGYELLGQDIQMARFGLGTYDGGHCEGGCTIRRLVTVTWTLIRGLNHNMIAT